MKVSDLKPADYNPRTITNVRLEALERSMREFGDLSGITFNRRTGRIIGGHQRVKHLQSAWPIVKSPAKDKTGTVAVGYVDAPDGRWAYREVDWTEAKEKAANVAANAHGGEFDKSLLAPLLGELKLATFDLGLLGLDNRSLNQLLDPPTDERADAEIPTAAPRVKPGDLWQLGDHRLFCGDSRKAEDVAAVMKKSRAPCMWTDPPYGVSYVGKTKNKLEIKNDGADGLEDLLTRAFAAAGGGALLPGAAIYVAHPAGPLSVTFGRCFLAAGWRLHETLVWVKDTMVLGHSDYHYKHEPIFYGYAPGEGRYGRGGKGWYGPDNATSVFEIPRPKRSEAHPTMKPVALVQMMLSNSTQSGDLVYDPFIGSGTTILAATILGRTCFGLEIDPAFCDVAIARWEQFTGKRAKKV